jgi:CRP/FNR family transcriptional regulator, cyclic AMP receptor protein
MPGVTLFDNDPGLETFAAGQSFFTFGEPGQAMYVVVEGSVDLTVRGKLLETVQPGGIFGEMALIDHKPRSADATAATAGRIAVVDQKRFLFLLRNSPFFAIEVMSIMADRLRRFNELL